MECLEKLQHIQEQLKAPKNLYNSFGKYKYRNAEGICEAVKPLLNKYNMIMVMSDEVIVVGEHKPIEWKHTEYDAYKKKDIEVMSIYSDQKFYIKSTVTIMDSESGDKLSVSAMARESEVKKGMDDSQITGTASSYARKYALNGLFLLDDTKDADSDEYHEEPKAKKSTPAPAPITYINDAELKELKELCVMAERTEEYIAEAMKVKSLQNIQSTQFGAVKAGLLKIINANKEKENSK